MLHTSEKTMTTFYHQPGNLLQSLQAHQGCPAAALSPTAQKGTILGHPVAVYTDNSVPGAVFNVKAALDLDCYPMFLTESFSSRSFNQTKVTSVSGRTAGFSVYAPTWLSGDITFRGQRRIRTEVPWQATLFRSASLKNRGPLPSEPETSPGW